MKKMNVLKKYASKINVKKPAVILGMTSFAVSAHAGAIADAVTDATADFKTDLASVGAEVLAIALVGLGFIAAIRLFRRGI